MEYISLYNTDLFKIEGKTTRQGLLAKPMAKSHFHLSWFLPMVHLPAYRTSGPMIYLAAWTENQAAKDA